MKPLDRKAFGPYQDFNEAKDDFKRLMKKDNFNSKECALIYRRSFWAFVDGYMVEQFPNLPDGPFPSFWGVRLDPTPNEKHGYVTWLYVPGVGDAEKEIIENTRHHK